MSRRCINDSREVLRYIVKDADGVKMYMFENEEVWITFEQSFIKYPQKTYKWMLFEEPVANCKVYRG